MLNYFATLSAWAELSATLLCLAATVFLWRGWRIRYGGRHHIIAGFAALQLQDPVAWARHAGLIDLALGAVLLAAALSSLIWPELIREIALLALLAIFFSWGPIITRLQRHEKP